MGGIIHLRHPVHGELALSVNSLEVGTARANGWEEFDPSAPVPAVEPEAVVVIGIDPATDQPEVVVPDFLKGTKKK